MSYRNQATLRTLLPARRHLDCSRVVLRERCQQLDLEVGNNTLSNSVGRLLSANQPKPATLYVAGPYTAYPAQATAAAAELWHALMDLGLHPFSPHMSHGFELVRHRPAAEWLEWDFRWLALCDVLVLLPGPSPGAELEVELATQLGKPIYRGPGELLLDLVDLYGNEFRPDPEPLITAWGRFETLAERQPQPVEPGQAAARGLAAEFLSLIEQEQAGGTEAAGT